MNKHLWTSLLHINKHRVATDSCPCSTLVPSLYIVGALLKRDRLSAHSLNLLCGSVKTSLPASMPPATYLHPCRQKKSRQWRDKKEVGIGQILQLQILLVLFRITTSPPWRARCSVVILTWQMPPLRGGLCLSCIHYARPAGGCQQQ